MRMGNRLVVPQSDGCYPTPAIDTPALAPTKMDTDAKDEAAPEPEPTMPPPRSSFEIMNQFNWDMVDTHIHVFCVVMWFVYQNCD